jgi:hypothetical protein
LGLTGEEHLVKLTYLCATTRLFDRIVSLAVKGPSSAGKSYTIRTAYSLLPKDSYIEMTSMSERHLIYSDQSVAHKIIIFFEESGITEGFLYGTVDKAEGKLEGRVIEKAGPTGLVITTIKLAIDAEMETRCISITANDTPEQTQAIMAQQAKLANRLAADPDLSEWHAFQTYLALQPAGVVIPFAEPLAQLIKPAAVRLRRDFPSLLLLIKAHALLHQDRRQRDANDAVLATVEDYSRVRWLMNELLSDAVGLTVPESVREIRKIVAELLKAKKAKDTVSAVERSVTIREIAVALDSLDSLGTRG